MGADVCCSESPPPISSFRNETFISLLLGALAAAGSLLGLSGVCLWPKGAICPRFMTSSQGQVASSGWLMLGYKGCSFVVSIWDILEDYPPIPEIFMRSAGCSVSTVSLYFLLPDPFTSSNGFLMLLSNKPPVCKSLSQNLLPGDST